MPLPRLFAFACLATVVAPAAICADTPRQQPTQAFSIGTPENDSLESIFNAFVATYAKDNIGWKKDIVLTSTPREVPAGRQVGLSERLGYYTFIPKTWCDFSPSEREAVLKDPRMRAFIVSTCQPATYPRQNAVNSPANKAAGFDDKKASFPITARPQESTQIKQ